MHIRLMILVGYKKDSAGSYIPDDAPLYFGTDGVKLQEAENKACQSGSYSRLIKFINPSGIPCPVIVDPKPKAPVFPKLEAKQPVQQQKKSEAQIKHEAERAQQEERRLAALEKDSTDMAIAREGKSFAELAALSKSGLTEMLSDLNSDLPDNQKVTVVPGAKKADLINSILVAQGIKKKPAVPNETTTNNENENV